MGVIDRCYGEPRLFCCPDGIERIVKYHGFRPFRSQEAKRRLKDMRLVFSMSHPITGEDLSEIG